MQKKNENKKRVGHFNNFTLGYQCGQFVFQLDFSNKRRPNSNDIFCLQETIYNTNKSEKKILCRFKP